MNSELIIKLLTIIVSIIALPKIFYDIYTSKSAQLREEYKFAKDFLYEVKANANLHPFLREKGYQAIAGNKELTSTEIEYLLSLQEPTRTIKEYILGLRYLQRISVSKRSIAFKEKYQSLFSRRLRKFCFVSIYVVFALLALSPLLLPSKLTAVTERLLAFVLTLLLFGTYAFFSLKQAYRIACAEKVVRKWQEYSESQFN